MDEKTERFIRSVSHPSLTEYTRKQIINKHVITKYEIVADVPEPKRLIREFGRIRNFCLLLLQVV